VGSAITRRLQADGFGNLVFRTQAELDLTDRAAVDRFFEAERPEYVFLAAALVGGIHANNSRPAEFIYANLAIQTNVIDAAYRCGVSKQAYARQYGFNVISLMPTNLYGPGDNFDLNNSHVLPALIRKVDDAHNHRANKVTIWGTGNPRREFLHVDDLARAAVFLMGAYDSPEIINIGTGEDLSIRELAEMVCRVIGFRGEIVYDSSRPDGTPRKLLDVSRLKALGWKPSIALEDGIRQTWQWYRDHAVATCV